MADAGQDRRLLRLAGLGDGDVAQVRAGQRMGVEDDREAGAELAPLHLAQAGDARIEVAAENGDGNRIPRPQLGGVGDVGVQHDQRRPGVIGGPPTPLGHPGVGRRGGEG